MKSILKVLCLAIGALSIANLSHASLLSESKAFPRPKEPYFTLSFKKLHLAQKSIDSYRGTVVAYKGEVTQALENSEGLVMIVYLDDQYSSEYESVVVRLAQPFIASSTGKTGEISSVKKGDTVTILGVIRGLVDGENAFGQSVTSVVLELIGIYTWEDRYYRKSHSKTFERWQKGTLWMDTDDDHYALQEPYPKLSVPE